MHAHQVTGGLFWHYKELDFSAEGYYKRMNNLVEYKDNGPVLPSFEGWGRPGRSGEGTFLRLGTDGAEKDRAV